MQKLLLDKISLNTKLYKTHGGEMKKIILSMVICLMVSMNAKSEVGINAALGVPFVTQYGVNLTMGPMWSADISYNNLSYTLGTASVDLTMPALMLNWHPMSGAFYIGLGVGQETLNVKSSESGVTAEGEVTSSTTIAKIGWMWGKANGGFWFGMDLAYVSPSGGDPDFTVTGGTATAEQVEDVEDSLDTFSETAYTNVTFARFGYLF